MVTVTMHNANVELPTEQHLHLTEGGDNKRRAADSAAVASHVGGAASRVGGAVSIQTTSEAPGIAPISSQGGDVSNQIRVATHAGVQAKAGPTAVHVETANQETQLRAVHVGVAAVQVGAANETQLQTVDQNMADVQTDHDMADVAVVEHSHRHEDEEQVEWEKP